MLDTGTFSHTGEGGSRATERIEDAGFPMEGESWSTRENLGYIGVSGGADLRDEIRQMHQNLLDSPSHRKNILDPDISRLQIAPLLPFVFIENAFKYGLKSATPFLNITIRVKDQILYFEIENDYLSEKAESQEIGGIGIKNVKRRLALLYPEKHDLEIISDENSYRVRLTVNLSDDVE